MNYKELLYNKDKVLSFYPELAVILNKYDEIECERIEKETGEKRKADRNGLNKAIFINQINYWNNINEKSGNNFKDGYYWVYNSYTKWAENDFPYWSVDTIKRIVMSLESIGIIVSANYNQYKIDKTKWYRIDYKRLQEIIDFVKEKDSKNDCTDQPSGQSAPTTGQVAPIYDRASCTDGKGNLSQTIPENTTEITNQRLHTKTLSGERAVSECEQSEPKNNQSKPNRKKEANALFEQLWSLYPLKKGKASVSDTQKLKLLDIGYEELERAISRYVKYVDSVDYLHYKNGSTFFNSGYVDYLDENYTDGDANNNTHSNYQQAVQPKHTDANNNPEDHKEAVHRAMQKAAEQYGEQYGEQFFEGMSDGDIEGMLGLLGIDVV